MNLDHYAEYAGHIERISIHAEHTDQSPHYELRRTCESQGSLFGCTKGANIGAPRKASLFRPLSFNRHLSSYLHDFSLIQGDSPTLFEARNSGP